MCGACGRIVVGDEVLGAERTLRSQFIVAQIIQNLCRTVPGLPSIQVAGDGWMLWTATGSVYPCQTVLDVWAYLFREADRTDSMLELLDETRTQILQAEGLAEVVLRAGLKEAGTLPH